VFGKAIDHIPEDNVGEVSVQPTSLAQARERLEAILGRPVTIGVNIYNPSTSGGPGVDHGTISS
jgi:hypothetical protein